LFESAELGETIEGRLHDRLGVVRTHRLREDVLQADHFQDSADATAGDEAGTRRSRTEHDDATIGAADDFVRNGVVAEVDVDEGAVSAVGPFANGIRDFLCLTVTNTNAALAITRHDERSEVKATATFDDLRATVDVDDLVVVLRSRRIVTIVTTWATRAARATRTTTVIIAARTTAVAARARTGMTGMTGITSRGGRGRGILGFFAHGIY